MTIVIEPDSFLESSRLPVVDVRSPSEFAQGHIPSATNVPLFSDAERAEVGTLYKQEGSETAIKRGRELAEAKVEQFLIDVRAVTPGPDLVVHCWRGGMRSEGFAEMLTQNGFQPQLIRGGYKAYRHAVRDCLALPRRIVILSGQSGAGKTRLLELLRDAGEQIIDLEDLAGHRGSVFGGIDLPPQPSIEQFENELCMQWLTLDAERPVWIEGESQLIGRVFIPHVFWEQMSTAPTIFIEVPVDERVNFLVQEYGDLPVDELAAAMKRISKRLGGARMQAALDALERQDVHTFAKIALEYYDKAYTNAQEKRPRIAALNVPLERHDQPGAVEILCQSATEVFALPNERPSELPNE